MSCIVGVCTKREIVLGCDSRVSQGDDIFITETKIVRRGGLVIGACGSLRVLNLVRNSLEVPKYLEKPLTSYACRDFIPCLQELLRESGAMVNDSGIESMHAELLVASKMGLFSICSFFSCTAIEDYEAIGSGSPFARGSLHSTKKNHCRTRIRKSLEASAAHCSSVGPPFKLFSIKRKLL